MKRGCLLLLGATSLLFATTGGADSQLSYVRMKADGQEYPQPPMEIANGMIRFASDLPSGQWMLFDSSKNIIVLVDEQEGTYTPLSKNSFEQISAMQKQAMAQIQEQLAQLPPDQREEAMRMMPQMSTMEKEAIRTERTTRTMDVAGHACIVLEIYRGQQKTSETCVVSRSELGIPKEDYGTLMAMQTYFVDISSAFFEMDTSYFFGDAAREEVPVYMVDFENSGKETTRFKSASFEKISSTRFELDPTLRKKDMLSPMNR